MNNNRKYSTFVILFLSLFVVDVVLFVVFTINQLFVGREFLEGIMIALLVIFGSLVSLFFFLLNNQRGQLY